MLLTFHDYYSYYARSLNKLRDDRFCLEYKFNLISKFLPIRKTYTAEKNPRLNNTCLQANEYACTAKYVYTIRHTSTYILQSTYEELCCYFRTYIFMYLCTKLNYENRKINTNEKYPNNDYNNVYNDRALVVLDTSIA